MEQESWVKWKGRKYRKWITGGGEGEKGVCFQQGGMSGDDVGTDSSQQKKHGPVTRGNSRRPQSGEHRVDWNVDGQGGEEESNAPQIASGIRSWKDRFLDPFFSHLHLFDCLPALLFDIPTVFLSNLCFLYEFWFDATAPEAQGEYLALRSQGNNMLKKQKQHEQAAFPVKAFSLSHTK